jgi:glycosyltransferase involved in cell wall biosynthesis
MNERAFADVEGPVVIACAAPFGGGGMGRHLRELVDFFRARNLNVENFDATLSPGWLKLVNRFTPLRFFAARQGFLEACAFDQRVARRLPAAKTFIGFNGQSLRSMQAARRLGYSRIYLTAVISHVNLAIAQARKAWEYAPIEPLGYIRAQHERMLHEYEVADRILYASDYVRQSFLAEGFPDTILERFDLSADARFKPAANKPSDGKFRVVSIGSLSFSKGVAVLLDAFKRFDAKEAELTLVGGSGTPKMRKYLEACLAQDSRVRLAPGDPLPHLQAADALVHASFQDGFGYAPAEALACGVPVVVTEHTGAKERVREGVNGFVVPVGDPDAIVRALKKIRETRMRA